MKRPTTQKWVFLILAAICFTNALSLGAAFFDLLKMQVNEGIRSAYFPESEAYQVPQDSTVLGVGIGAASFLILGILFVARFVRGRYEVSYAND